MQPRLVRHAKMDGAGGVAVVENHENALQCRQGKLFSQTKMQNTILPGDGTSAVAAFRGAGSAAARLMT